jgi:pilus assembly protein CpaC
MNNRHRFKRAPRLCALLATAVMAFGGSQPASAAAPIPSTMGAVAQTLVVCKDKSVAFRLGFPVGEIVVAQPDVLQLVATTDQSFYVRGKAVGSTNLLVYDKDHRLMQVIDVRVGYDVEGLQADIAVALPREHIQAVNFAGGILLSGEASTLSAASRAEEIAEHYAPKAVSSQLSIAAAEQVMVEVRILEVRRDALKDIGVNLNAHNDSHFRLLTGSGILDNLPPQGVLTIGGTIHGTSVQATLQALEEKGVVRTLAKPTLLAMSGEEASFLAGGEFPYPVPNGPQQVSIEFKPFGVTLNVTPWVEDDGQIRLKIAPEVSALDPSNHLQIDGFNLPSLTDRRASTTIKLRDGQSFAIAGLFQQDYQSAVSQIPWASDVPILGALFRSTSWKRNESELVIIVTPHLTAPSDKLDDLPNPLASPDEPDPTVQLLLGKALDQPMKRPVSIK